MPKTSLPPSRRSVINRLTVLPIGLILLGLTACSASPAETSPTVESSTEAQAPTSPPTPVTEESTTEPVAEASYEGWDVDFSAMAELSEVHREYQEGNRSEEFFQRIRQETCDPFISANSHNVEGWDDLEPMTVLSSNEEILERAVGEQELLQAFTLTVFEIRQWEGVPAADELSGVEVCLRSGVPALDGTEASTYIEHVAYDTPVLEVETEIGSAMLQAREGHERAMEIKETDESGNEMVYWREYRFTPYEESAANGDEGSWQMLRETDS